MESPGLERAAMLLRNAKRPLILAGHGVTLGGAEMELRLLAERTGIPVVTTLLGISAFPDDHPLYLGWPGMHGQASVNRAIDRSDLLFAVGMRFDDRITGAAHKFAPSAKIIHIDVDPSELGKVIKPTVGIAADAKAAMRSILGHLDNAPDGGEGCEQWREELAESQEPERRRKESARGEYGPIQVMEAIKAAAGPDLRLVTDVGQHQMWAAQFFEFTKANSHITSGGLGTMGFALPAAMGVAFAYPEEPVWVIAGDGGIQMNIQELATIRDFGLNIKVAVLNNGYLGMVRQWQQFFHNRRYSETPITGPDYEQLTASYGLAGRTVSEGDDVEEAVQVGAGAGRLHHPGLPHRPRGERLPHDPDRHVRQRDDRGRRCLSRQRACPEHHRGPLQRRHARPEPAAHDAPEQADARRGLHAVGRDSDGMRATILLDCPPEPALPLHGPDLGPRRRKGGGSGRDHRGGPDRDLEKTGASLRHDRGSKRTRRVVRSWRRASPSRWRPFSPLLVRRRRHGSAGSCGPAGCGGRS